jgi:hypothetical protein
VRTVLLIHSPLLGPSSWRPCADLLEAAGHPVVLPDLRFSVTPPAGWWDRAADAAAAAVATADTADGLVVVGHSGAGVLLPTVATRARPVAAVVFVDAVLPAPSGVTIASERLRSFVAGLPTEDGLLPPWSQWWGDAAMAELVPDPAARAAVAAGQPRLSPEFWAEPVPVPAGWPGDRAGYLRLSPAYVAEETEAARRGWPVRTIEGTHLDPVVRPDEVVAAVLEVADAAS